MRPRRSDAIVLTTYPQRERDKLVVFLTPDQGLLRGWAYGVRGARARFGASLEPLSRVILNYRERENDEIVRIESVELVHASFGLQGGFRTSATLSYLAELVATFAQPREPSLLMFRLLDRLCRAAAAGVDVVRIAAYAEVWILALSGLLPSTSQCSECGGGVATPLRLSDDGDGFLCRDCSETGGRTLPAGTGQALMEVLTHSVEDFARSHVDPEDLFDLRMFAVGVRRNFLGHELKSWEIMQSAF